MQVQSTQFSQTAAARTQPDAPGAGAVDFQSFLQLLTAQLRNQDPLSPLDSTQFVAQLANFSTVEQLVSANARLDRLADELTGSGLDDYASWIGRTAEIEGGAVRYDGSPAAFRFEPLAGAVEATLVVRDQSGAEVHRAAIANGGGVQLWTGAGGRPGEVFALDVELRFDAGAAATRPAIVFDGIEGVRDSADGAVFTLSSGLTATRDSIRGLVQTLPR